MSIADAHAEDIRKRIGHICLHVPRVIASVIHEYQAWEVTSGTRAYTAGMRELNTQRKRRKAEYLSRLRTLIGVTRWAPLAHVETFMRASSDDIWKSILSITECFPTDDAPFEGRRFKMSREDGEAIIGRRFVQLARDTWPDAAEVSIMYTDTYAESYAMLSVR
jgi:hypothetical protein